MEDSRTAKSFKNAKISLSFYFINLILSFFSRKVFIVFLGADVLGLNSTISNILVYLNLAELGIGYAIGYSLYKPMFDNNKQSVNEIISIQGWLYQKIALFVIFLSGIVLTLFPYIFGKTDLPLWYAYSTFIVLLSGSLFSYFFNYKQFVLVADQKEYKLTINIQGLKIVKVILQILAILYLQYGYIYWLAIEFLMSIFTSILLNTLVKKEYPWLKATPALGEKVKDKYPHILQKTKQLFFHKIANVVLTQSSPIIIYMYISLTMVTIYGNYLLIISGITLLVNSVFSSIGAGIGNLVAEGDDSKITSIFNELLTSRIWLVSALCFGIYQLSNSFIELWVGKDYILDNFSLICMLVIAFISLTRLVDLFIAAYGLYQDVWAAILEAFLNLSLSLLLGYFFGIQGILVGGVISLIVIALIWKPYFLFKFGFQKKCLSFYIVYFKCAALAIISFVISLILVDFLDYGSCKNYFEWIVNAAINILIYMLVSTPILYFSSYGIRCFIKRVKTAILN
nr:sugar transporter [uncultured Macellibacteroides sp.]